MRGTSPYKILTIEIDLEDVQQRSKDMTLEQLKIALGDKLIPQIEKVIKCK